jgi:hypothetical protein
LGSHHGERGINDFDDLCVHPCERKAALARADVTAANNRDDRQTHRPDLAHENARNRRGQTGKHSDTDLAESNKTRVTGAA